MYSKASETQTIIYNESSTLTLWHTGLIEMVVDGGWCLPISGIAESIPCCAVVRRMSQATAGNVTEKPKMSMYMARMSRQQDANIPTLYLPKPYQLYYIHTYQSLLSPRLAEASQIFLRDAHVLLKLISSEDHRYDRW
jgi:hypothetical protein